jgi:hypothetical protein
MAKTLDLDDPFRRGETVLTTRPLPGLPEGTEAKVRMINGLSDFNGGTPWLRYWIRVTDGRLVGQVDHDDLVRPNQIDAWADRQEARLAAADEPAVTEDATPVAAGDGGDGPASLIPADLLERSKAAKARLLGG